MITGFKENQCRNMSLKDIDVACRLTDFSRDPPPELLENSILQIGIIHPILLTHPHPLHRVISGHRRLKVAGKAGHQEIPARIIDRTVNEKTMLSINLSENRSHRQYSDIEKAGILDRLVKAGINESKVIQDYMPMLALERNKKLFENFLQAHTLNESLKQLLHDTKVPLRHFSAMLDWDRESQDAVERVFNILRPGINKWRDLLDLIDDLAKRERQPPANILSQQEIQAMLKGKEAPSPDLYDTVHQFLHDQRNPFLSGLQKKLVRILDQLQLAPGTRVRTPENFETEEIKIELDFKNEKEFSGQVKKLSEAGRSKALTDLIRLFKDLK